MKEKTYKEEEIFEIINDWYSDLKLEEELENYTEVSPADICVLKDKFRTPQGFRRAIKDAGLTGTQFD